MSIVQSAAAEPAGVVARGRYSVADPTAVPLAGRPESDFASVFSTTRESAWLEGLLRKKGDATRSGQTRQRKAEEAAGEQAAQKKSRPADAKKPDAPSSRTERIDEARRDLPEKTEHSAGQKRQPVEEVRRERAERLEETRTSERRESASPETPEDPREEELQPSTGQPTDGTTVPVVVAGPVTPQPVTPQPDKWPIGSANASTSSAGNGPVATQVSPPAPWTTGETANQTVMPVEPAPASVQPTVGHGEADGGARLAAGGNAAAAKGGEATAKPGTAGNEFHAMLQQVGRERAVAVRQAVAGSPRPLTEETVRLNRSEAIDQIARVVRTHANGRASSMTLRLDPPELGQLRVDVRMQDHSLVVRFQTQTQAAHDLLQDRIAELRHALEQHGIQLDRAEIEIRPPTPGQQGRHADGQQHNLPQGGESGFGQAAGQQRSGDGSHEPGASGGSGSETWTSGDGSASHGLPVGEVDAMSETGVDLVV